MRPSLLLFYIKVFSGTFAILYLIFFEGKFLRIFYLVLVAYFELILVTS